MTTLTGSPRRADGTPIPAKSVIDAYVELNLDPGEAIVSGDQTRMGRIALAQSVVGSGAITVSNLPGDVAGLQGQLVIQFADADSSTPTYRSGWFDLDGGDVDLETVATSASPKVHLLASQLLTEYAASLAIHVTAAQTAATAAEAARDDAALITGLDTVDAAIDARVPTMITTPGTPTHDAVTEVVDGAITAATPVTITHPEGLNRHRAALAGALFVRERVAVYGDSITAGALSLIHI